MTSHPAPYTPRGAWWAVGAGFTVLFVCTGVNFTFGILFKPILNELGGDRATLSLAPTASLVMYAFSQPFFGSLIDRFGVRRVILPSMALMAVGTGLVPLAGSPWQLMLFYGIIASTGYTGTGILPVSILVTKWFPGRRGFAMAVAACGFSLGHLVFTQGAARVEGALGWRWTYALMAALLVGFLAVLTGWLRDPPRMPVASGLPGPPIAPAVSTKRRAAMGTGAFWWMTSGYMGCGFTDFLITTHLAPFATDLGLAQAVAANAISLFAAGNIAAILVAGLLSDRFGSRRVIVATYVLRATALFLLLFVRETWHLYIFAILFGATFFTTAPLSSAFIGELFGPAFQGSIFGTANMFHHVAGALGAFSGGLVFDLTHSYTPIFLASGFMVVGSAVTTWLARSPRRPVR
jgi:MFS family permease